jgi:hypothetical protein
VEKNGTKWGWAPRLPPKTLASSHGEVVAGPGSSRSGGRMRMRPFIQCAPHHKGHARLGGARMPPRWNPPSWWAPAGCARARPTRPGGVRTRLVRVPFDPDGMHAHPHGRERVPCAPPVGCARLSSGSKGTLARRPVRGAHVRAPRVCALHGTHVRVKGDPDEMRACPHGGRARVQSGSPLTLACSLSLPLSHPCVFF